MVSRLVALVVLVQTTILFQVAPSPSVSITPPAGEAGDTITAVGADWQPAGSIELFLDTVGGTLLAVGDVGRNGDFTLRFTIPTGTSPGAHNVIACLDRNAEGGCREVDRDILTVFEDPASTTTTTTSTTSTTSSTTSTTTTTSTTSSTTTTPTTTSTTPPVQVSTTTQPPTTTLPLAIATTTTSLPLAVAPTPTQPQGPALADPNAPEWPDLEVVGFEVTQGIQDLQNRMPLVAGRRTWVRLTVAADRLPDNAGTQNLTGEAVGTEWSYSGWEPVEGALLLRSGGSELVLYPENGPVTAFGDGGDRLDPDSTLNFLLPVEWTAAGPLEMTAFIWSFQPSTPDTMEPDAANNFSEIDVTFWTADEPVAYAIRLGNEPVWSAVSPAAFQGAVDMVEESLLVFHPISGATIYQLTPWVGPGDEVTEEEDPDGNWDLNDRAWEPNQRLGWFHALWDLPENEWFVGIAPNNASSKWSGWANPGSNAFWTKGSTTTPGHEMGHAQGLLHVGCKDTNDPIGVPDELAGGAIDETHATAFPNCSLAPVDPGGYFGFTTRELNPAVYTNDPDASGARFPFMSYANPEWTDPYHTCLLLQSYGVPCDPIGIGAPPVFQVVDFGQSGALTIEWQQELFGDAHDGWINLISVSQGVNAAPQLGPGMLLAAPTLGARRLLADQVGYLAAQVGDANADGVVDGRDFLLWQEGRASVRGVDSSGATTFTLPLALDGLAHGGGGDVAGSSNLLALPWPEGTVRLEVLGPDGGVVDARSLSSPPVVALDPVEVDDRTVRASWTGTDPDDDPISYSVLASADGGDTWRSIEVLSPATSITIGEDYALAGGDEVVVRVVATDGLATTTVDTPPFSLPDAAPWVAVNRSLTEVPLHAPLEISASAFDPEDGPLTAIEWTSSVDGDLGVGDAISTRGLSVGTHVLTATVRDSAGALGVDSISVEVVDTGLAAPRAEGSIPEAELLLRAGVGGFVELADTPDAADPPTDEPRVAAPQESAGRVVPWAVALGVLVLLVAVTAWRRLRTR